MLRGHLRWARRPGQARPVPLCGIEFQGGFQRDFADALLDREYPRKQILLPPKRDQNDNRLPYSFSYSRVRTSPTS